jgi:hypothetical protein
MQSDNGKLNMARALLLNNSNSISSSSSSSSSSSLKALNRKVIYRNPHSSA